MSLLVSNCDCCNAKAVACVVTKAGLLPRMSICKNCDTNGLFIALSTYKSK